MPHKIYNDCKQSAIDAIIASRVRHLAVNMYKHPDTPRSDKRKYQKMATDLSNKKVASLEDLVRKSEFSNDEVSVDIRDDKGHTKSITADFNKDDGHMSLHVIKGSSKLLDIDRKGRQESTGYGENDEFIGKTTGLSLPKLAGAEFEKYKKKYNLKETIEFYDDLNNIYGNKVFNIENSGEVLPDLTDVFNTMKDVQYGFISIKDGSRIDDREWIHNCRNLGDFYRVQTNPEITIKEKLGICTDQCLAIKYLFDKYHSEYKTQMYALMKGRFGHCVIGFEAPDGKWYYLESSWNKERGLHGSFPRQSDLEEYFKHLYHKHHDKDNDDEVILEPYEKYISSLNEAVACVRGG